MISSNPTIAGLADPSSIWAKLAAPLPQGVVSWRQDGRAIQRDGKFLARFVCYVDANTVRERLDSVVPGEWDLQLELLPPLSVTDDDSEPALCSFKSRLQILGVIREDVGTGKDYKSAATDAFKRVAVRFGIAHELYAYEQNWVQVDGDGRYAKPLEDPQAAYDRRHAGAVGTPSAAAVKRNGGGKKAASDPAPALAGDGTDGPNRRWLSEQLDTRGALTDAEAAYIDEKLADGTLADGDFASLVARTKKAQSERAAQQADAPAAALAAVDATVPACPKCGGRMWDNRATKRNPKAPDYKCRDRSCDGVVWPPRDGSGGRGSAAKRQEPPPPIEDESQEVRTGTDDLPF